MQMLISAFFQVFITVGTSNISIRSSQSFFLAYFILNFRTLIEKNLNFMQIYFPNRLKEMILNKLAKGLKLKEQHQIYHVQMYQVIK